MVIKGVNFWSFLFASQMAGWLMFLVDEIFAGWFGLFGLFPGLKSPAWIIHHQIDSTLFAIPFVLPAVYNRIPGGGFLKGLIYGFGWHVFVTVVSFIGTAGGSKWFQPMQATAMISLFLLHLVYGAVIGFLYNPPESE